MAAGYALVAAAWIIGTDSIGYWMSSGGNASLVLYLSGIGKGLLFVAVTAAILYALILKLCKTERIREHATLDTTAQILDASPTVLFRWSNAAGWPLEFVSENVRQFGYEASALLAEGARFENMVHPEDLPGVTRRTVERGRADEDRFEQTFRLISGNGGTLWVSGRMTVVRDDMGQVLFYQGTLTDVTERMTAEHALRASERRFHVFMDANPALAWINDADGHLVYANRAWQKLSGMPLADCMGRTAAEMMEPATAERLRRAEQTVLEKGMPVQAMLQTAVFGGDTRTWQVVRFPYDDMVGEQLIGGLAVDVTEQHRAEERARVLLSRIEHAMIDTVKVISQMMELRDPYTAGHENRVGELAAAIGAEMGLDAHVQHGLRIAAALHDVGKISVPSEILSKPGRLSDAEMSLVRTHAERGHELLRRVSLPWPVADVAHQHHERLDGSGYPQGLKGDDIRLEARITAVADVVEAMSSHRPYREGLGIDVALSEIEKNRGRFYDTDAVDACLRLFREKGYTLSVTR